MFFWSTKGDIGANAEIASRQRAGTLPPISGSFFGRDDLLDTITKQLFSREDVVISGPPGIGKTKLAIRAGYRLKEKGVTVYFATFQEFIYEELASQGISRSDSKKKVLSAICSVVLDSIGLNQHKTEEAEMTLNNWLHMCSNPHVLIMDNVESMLVANIKEQFFDLLSRLTKCEHLRLCFTSREKFQITELGTTECIVPPLDIENSIQLVKHCTRLGKLEESELTNEQAKELSMTCCCLPLALRIACALVNENKVHATFYQTLELLKKSNPDRMKHFRSDKWKQTSMVLERSIEVSYLRFTPTLKETAVALSVFPDEFDAKAASHVLNVPDLDKCRAFYLLPLMHRSFLGYNEKTKRYSFHPFIREFLVISARKERQTFENAQIRYLEYFLEYFQDAAKIYRSSFPDGAKPAMKLFSLEKANIQTTFEFMCSNPETISQELATKYSHALQFPTFARTRLHLELCQRASKVCARLTHRYGMHADALFHYGVEGSYYGYYAKYSDFPKIKRITDEILARADTEEDKGKKALALTSLALAYLANTTSTENIIRCLYFSFRALELCRKTFGDHFVTMLAHFIVGGIYGYSYIPHKAMDHFREALRIARDALQLGDHPEVTSILAHMGQNMALFARSESDLKQALSFFQEGKEILHRLNTSSHADLIRINYETGYILTKLHNFPEAEDVLRKAIDVGTRLLGDHRLVVWSFKYLTRLQRDMGELDKAIFYATKALEMAQRLDKQSGLTADSFVDLAELYGRIRDYDLCLENHLRSLQLDPSRNKRFVPKKDSFIAIRTLASMKNGLLNFAKNCLVTDSVVMLLVSVVHGINSLLRLLLSKSESVTLPIRKEQSREYDDYNEPLYYRLEELKKLLDDREELNTEPTGTKKMIRACKHAAEVYKLWGCPMEEQNIAQRARDLSHDISENEIQPDIKTWLQTKGNVSSRLVCTFTKYF